MSSIAAPAVQVFSEHADYITAQLQGFNDAIDTLASRWKDLLVNLVADVKSPEQQLAARQIYQLSIDIQSQLNQIGFTETAKQFITGYDDSILFAHDSLKVLGRADLHLSPLMDNALANIRQMDLEAFQEIGTRAVRTLARELTMNAIVGTPKATMIQNLNKVLDGEFINQGQMYAETALRSYDRQATMAVWQEADISHFKYAGPKDLRNRPFCQSHVNKIYAISEIRKMSNATKWPVWPYLGGPRCRHYLLPQPDAMPEPQQDYSSLD